MAGKRPRVVHVYKDVYPPVQGGIERTIHQLALHTRERFDVGVIVASRDRRGRTRTIAPDIDVTEVASFGRAFSAPLAPGFIDAIRRSRADLLHFHIPHPTGEMAWLLSGLRIPAVATYHSDVVRQQWAMGIYGRFFHAFLSRLHTIMPTSQRYLQTSLWLAPHADRCQVVPLGFDLRRYRATPAIKRRAQSMRTRYGEFALFLGCLRAYKGLHNLLMATAMAPRLRVVIAGDGPMGGELRALASRLGIDDRVTLTGRVSDEEAVALLHASAMVVLPSHLRSEAFGLVQVEAMACGKPVISTDLPTGVPEVNPHGITGLIVPPQEPQALADAMMSLLNDPQTRREMGAAGRRRARLLYTAERMAAAVERVYCAALGLLMEEGSISAADEHR